jgi:hypothetical protein
VGVDGVDDEVVGISDVDGVADEEVVTGGSEETLRLTVVIGSAGAGNRVECSNLNQLDACSR